MAYFTPINGRRQMTCAEPIDLSYHGSKSKNNCGDEKLNDASLSPFASESSSTAVATPLTSNSSSVSSRRTSCPNLSFDTNLNLINYHDSPTFSDQEDCLSSGIMIENTPVKKRKGTPASSPQTPSRKVKVRKYPSSMEEASPEDRMLITWKEANKPLLAIAARWKEMTGKEVKPNYVATRYIRIKSNMVRFVAEDDTKLVRAKSDVELRFEHEKWQLISKAIEDLGGAKYPAAACEKRYKQLSSHVPPIGGYAILKDAANDDDDNEEG